MSDPLFPSAWDDPEREKDQSLEASGNSLGKPRAASGDMTGPPSRDPLPFRPWPRSSDSRSQDPSEHVRGYLTLTKPRIVGLLTLVAACGFLVGSAGPGPVRWFDGLVVVITGALAAAGSGALNNYHDRDIDPRMERTRQRPIPAGRLPAWHALVLGSMLSVSALSFGLWLLPAQAVAWISAGWVTYLGVYTMGLKRPSVWGVILGGTAGSFAVLAGLATAGGPIPADGWVMAGVVAVWTLPHAWAKALVHVDDFRRVGVATLPATTDTSVATLVISATAIGTVLAAGSTAFLIGPIYALGSLPPLAVLVLGADQLHRHPTEENARFLFHASNIVLALLFVLWTVDAWIQTAQAGLGLLALVLTTAALDRLLSGRLPAPAHPILDAWRIARGRLHTAGAWLLP